MKLLPNDIITSQDLVNLTTALATAVQVGILQRQHAEGVLKKALDLSGFNTEKPVVRKNEQTVVETTIEEKTESYFVPQQTVK